MVYSIHEHELRPGVDVAQYEQDVAHALGNLHVPGLVNAQHLKGFKGTRTGKYAVLWIFESAEVIEQNFGTADNPKWPADWLHYENEVLAQYLDRHPDTVVFTDYEIVEDFYF